jgi:hypothetical protein
LLQAEQTTIEKSTVFEGRTEKVRQVYDER